MNKIIAIRQSQPINYGAEELKKELRELRDYIAFDLTMFLGDDVTAKELSGKLFVLDYLVRSVDFEEMEVAL